jgi:ATP-dependent DNA helicase RecQ
VLGPRPAAVAGSGRGRRVAGVPPDDPLFLALKALRTEFAKSEAVPAYVVFTDRTLIEIAGKRPTTQSALRAIHGVGEAKLAHYGEAFLDVVRAHGNPAFSPGGEG